MKASSQFWVFIATFIGITITFSCGPTAEEMKAIELAEVKKSTTLKLINECKCDEVLLEKYIGNDSCEYYGILHNYSYDVVMHSSQCKKCHKKDYH